MHPDPDGTHRRRLAAQGAHGRAWRRVHSRRRLLPWLLPPLALLVLSLVVTAGLRWVDPPTTAFILAARFDAAAAGQHEFSIDQQWLPLVAISPWAGAAVIAAEDQKFPRHHGFDLESVADAWRTQQAGGPVRGASTITQQLAKNLYLWSGRSWLRKSLEAWFTVLLEATLPKARILELYLNVVELGPALYGVGAASAHYFGHHAAGLSAAEASALAAVLPNPRSYSVTASSAGTRERQQWILQQMQQLGGLEVVRRLGR